MWVCGNLYLENFGSYKGYNRLACFDLNDSVEAAWAPTNWQLVRMLTCIKVAHPTGRSACQGLRTVQNLPTQLVQALNSGKANWVGRETAEGQILDLLVSLHERQRSAFISERTELKSKR